ncbi:MAG: phosphate acyltransferase PlsX [bacterium]
MIKLALDAMGGDHAPTEIVRGAFAAAALYPDTDIILIGQKDKVVPLIERMQKKHHRPNISFIHASEVVEMNESPTQAIKQKKDSSLAVAVKLVKNHEAQAIISAGNTGALMASSLLGLGRIKGIERPAIATIFPTANEDQVLLLDMGANVDCKPKNLVQFAHMGVQYAEHVMHKVDPRVGLLSIGEEAEKGNELTIKTNEILQKEKLNFTGNVEGKDILAGKVDIVICDGFVGNVVLKLSESISTTIFALLKEEINRSLLSKIGALLLLPAFKHLKKRIDYDEYGGALMLGLQGVCIKAHGRARETAIKNALRVARESVKENFIGYISQLGGN